MRALLIAFAVIAILLTGCRSAPYSNPNWREELDAHNKKLRLIVQVCLATNTGIVGFSTLSGGSIKSMDSTGAKKSGETSIGQAVFETYSAFPEELIANIVEIKGEKMQYVFSTATTTATTEWSDWVKPLFTTDDRNFAWQVLHAKSYAKTPSMEIGPKVRYILMSFNDYLHRVTLRRDGKLSESIPPC
ncbi:MAG: hypothetical protein FD135_5269 [Comamonadaceae bacterium]|nr:MAG: hypothetical protein FD135_5269 [Comamonadaceae bacterium]